MTIRTLSTTVIIGLISVKTVAQNFHWLGKAGGQGADNSKAITLDSDNNVITVLEFNGTADLVPGAEVANYTSAGLTDIAVVKTTQTGEVLWIAQCGGSGLDRPTGVDTDPEGNIYVTGTYRETADFDPGSEEFLLTSNGFMDIFLLKLSPDGNLIWVNSIGGNEFDESSGITVTDNNEVIITGQFHSLVDFDPGPELELLTTMGESDIFVCKFGGNGALIWVKSMGGMGSEQGFSVTTDDSGNVLIAGTFNGITDFDPGPPLNYLFSLWHDAFITKLSSAGDFIWAKHWGSQGMDFAYQIISAPDGNIYVAGSFMLTVDFDPSVSTQSMTANGQLSDLYVTSFEPNGDFRWVIGGGDVWNDEAHHVTADENDNIIVSGYFRGTAEFEPFSLESNGLNDGFVLISDTEGNVLNLYNIGGNGNDRVSAVAATSEESIYLTGKFSNTLPYQDQNGAQSLVSSGSDDVFIGRLNLTPDFIGAFQIEHNSLIYPNPATHFINLSSLPIKPTAVRWLTTQGQVIHYDVIHDNLVLDVPPTDHSLLILEIEHDSGLISRLPVIVASH